MKKLLVLLSVAFIITNTFGQANDIPPQDIMIIFQNY